MFEFVHKYDVKLNDNVTLFQPKTYLVDALLTSNVLSMNIKSLLYIYFDVDILTSLTRTQNAKYLTSQKLALQTPLPLYYIFGYIICTAIQNLKLFFHQLLCTFLFKTVIHSKHGSKSER